MPSVRLTARTVPSLQAPPAGQMDYFDSALPGFGVRVSVSGRRSYILLYRHLGRLRRWTIGRHPQLSLAEARGMARRALAELAQGKDPASRKLEARHSGDFKSLVQSFLDANSQRLRPKTLKEWNRLLEREILPELGRLAPHEITRAHIRGLSRRIAQRAPVVGNRTYELIRRIYSWAVSEDLIGVSPCYGLKKPSEERSRERVLNAGELRQIWEALEQERPIIASVFRLLFLTGARRGEVLGARWADIDLQQKLWTISTTKMKRQHVLPLSVKAIEVLGFLRPLAGHSEWIFVGPTGKAISSPQKAKARIQNRSGVQFTIHDIRRTVSTGLASIGVSSEIISAILNHAPGGPAATRIYNRYQPLPEMRAALERWAAHLERIVSGQLDEQDDTNLLPFRA